MSVVITAKCHSFSQPGLFLGVEPSSQFPKQFFSPLLGGSTELKENYGIDFIISKPAAYPQIYSE